MIMTLSLLVYAIAKRFRGTNMKTTIETIPNQINNAIATPTFRWVFLYFEGINLVQPEK
jgi:hypothetical protein